MRNLTVSKKVSRWLSTLALAVGAVASASAADVTIPTTGLDIAGYITAAITAVAAVFAVVVGGYFAFLIVKKAMRWAGKALG
jgi:hypothetical protein